jgi:hypothetical protein
MAWDTLIILLAGIAIVVYGADEAIKSISRAQRSPNNPHTRYDKP